MAGKSLTAAKKAKYARSAAARPAKLARRRAKHKLKHPNDLQAT